MKSNATLDLRLTVFRSNANFYSQIIDEKKGITLVSASTLEKDMKKKLKDKGGDKNAADQGSVDLMRKELNSIDMSGEIVIVEGEMDEAPMLYIGEKVWKKNGQQLDIALDPLEGTNFVAKNLPNAFSMLAVSE